jgi:hypothetical protein
LFPIGRADQERFAPAAAAGFSAGHPAVAAAAQPALAVAGLDLRSL